MIATDADKWFQTVFKPAAIKAGYTTLSDQVLLLNQVHPQTAANLGRIFIQQEETLAQHGRNYMAAPDLDASIANLTHDPTAALQSVTAALNDLGAAATSPAMAKVGEALTWLAARLRELESVANDNPIPTVTATAVVGGGALGLAGWYTVQAFTGFGLRSSATALDAAAADLTGAAVALRGGAQLPNVPGASPGGSAPEKLTLGAILGGAGALGLVAAIDTVVAKIGEGVGDWLFGKPKEERSAYANLGFFDPTAGKDDPEWFKTLRDWVHSTQLWKNFHGTPSPDEVPGPLSLPADAYPTDVDLDRSRKSRLVMHGGGAFIDDPEAAHGQALAKLAETEDKAAEAQRALAALRGPYAIELDLSAVDGALGRLQALRAALAGLGSGVSAPSLGVALRGNFTSSGIHGE